MNMIKDPMLYDHLQVLIAVAESKNFRAAAEKLGMSQPAVTLKLQKLEALQPVPLFNLEGKRKVLTHYGRSLYEVAKASSQHIERAIEELNRSYAAPETLKLRLGGRIQVLEYMVPHMPFAGSLELHNYTSSEAIERLKSHDIDVAISYRVPDSTELQAKKIFSSRLNFSVHKKFLKGQELNRSLIEDKEFLLRTPCISYGHDGHILRQWAKAVGISFTDLNIKYVTDDWRTVRVLVDKGFGYGFLPFYCQSESKQVESFEAPGSAIERLDFYMIFEKSLKKVEAFKPFLSFTDMKI